MDEKMRILNLVAEGKVTPDQAAQLLAALAPEESDPTPVLSPEAYDRKMFRITVDSSDGDKVNVQFPVKGIKAIIKATGKLPISVAGDVDMNMDALMDAVCQCLDGQVVGDFVTVDSADGDHIRIFVE